MGEKPTYTILHDPDSEFHWAFVEAKYHSLILDVIENQLSHSPQVETRNRKPLARPASFGATWELRCGPRNRFRVFYNVDEVNAVVYVLAIGMKERNRLFIAGEEVKE
jgi:mRNA-degrading endonuclease RelE of RelBE toxin-antitoxin system